MGEEKTEKFYNKNMYKHIDAESKYQNLYDKVLDFIPPDKNISILDIGCGVGGLFNTLLNHNYKNISGIDFSSYCINYCKKRFKTYKFYKFDLRLSKIDFYFEDYNVFICLEVLEHILNDKHIIKQIPPEKLFIFSVPNYDSASHARSFNNILEIKNRFRGLLVIENYIEIPINYKNKIFLIKSRRL